MYTKTIYVIIDCLAAIDILFVVRAIGRIRERYGKWLKWAMMASVVAIFANILIALSFNSSFAEFSYCLYFGSIDWILYFLCGFCLLYTEHDRAMKKLYIPAAVIMCADSLSIALNPVFSHHFYIYENTDTPGTIFYQTAFHPAYYAHLVIDYIAIVVALFFILYRIFRSYSFYRAKYAIILFVLLLVIILNIIYIAFSLVLDISVIFYPVAGTLIYFCINILVPRGLINTSVIRAVDDMNEGLILFDINENCIYANVFSKNRFHIDETTFRITDEPVATVISSLKSRGKAYGECEFQVGEKYYRIRRNALTDKKHHSLGSYYLIEDTTEEVFYLKEINEAKNEADSANQAKSLFLANMSHEIRTPLNSVLGMNELIMRSTEDPQLLEYADNIRSSGDMLLSLINDILDFSKIEANRMDLILADYNPHEMLRNCYQYFVQTTQAKDLYFHVSCDPTMPARLTGDEQHIKQILSNIVSNAVKYTNEGGITVSMSAEDTSRGMVDLIIQVFDTGIGISEEDAKYLFDPFRRVNEKQNATIQGTGLGLAITKDLLDLMGGTVSVESAPGRGSTFKVILPQKIADPSPIGTFALHEQTGPVQNRYQEKFRAPNARILVVDDVSVNLSVITGLLKKTQIRIDKALSGDEAIAKCREVKYDLILLDHRMPQKDGIETFHVISQSGLNQETPVIMLTANVLSGAGEEYKKIGFAAYLAKPVPGDELEKTLLQFLPKEKIEQVT